MDTEDMRRALQPYNLRAVARDTGINYFTLWRFARGKRTSTAHTLDKLRAYMERDK